MSRLVLELALLRYYRRNGDPEGSALRLLAQYDAERRTEAFAEGAALLEDRACDADFTASRDYIAGLREGAEVLTRATGEKSSPAGADATPDFFQPGHTYVREDHNGSAEFHVEHIANHPEDYPVAFGWYRRTPLRSWHAYTSDDYSAGWSEAAEGGAS